jgi:hypothetical protein
MHHLCVLLLPQAKAFHYLALILSATSLATEGLTFAHSSIKSRARLSFGFSNLCVVLNLHYSV